MLIGLALLWSASPVAQASRNRCHRLRPIAPFGPNTLRDAVVQGATSGAACVGACWPWMLVPAAAGGAHLAAMVLVTLLLLLERMAPAAPPHWRWPPAVSMVAALA
ncbi:Putative metal-binding membrane protein (fragment) [Beijerinckiaceae bacterium RH AL1]